MSFLGALSAKRAHRRNTKAPTHRVQYRPPLRYPELPIHGLGDRTRRSRRSRSRTSLFGSTASGAKLNQADFILTLLSVFWDQGRAGPRALLSRLQGPDRCRRHPRSTGTSSRRPRRCCGCRSRSRSDGRCSKQVYTLLRGKDVETGAQAWIQNGARRSSRSCKHAHEQGPGPDQTGTSSCNAWNVPVSGERR